jgi:hypothetical protein
VGNSRRANVFDAAVAIYDRAEIVEGSFPATEQHGHNGEMHLIDERSPKVLPDGGRPAPHKNITATSSITSCAQSLVDPAVNEMEGSSPLHFDGGTRLVSENEDRMSKGRLLSPPAGPLAVAPRSTYRTEHVSDS